MSRPSFDKIAFWIIGEFQLPSRWQVQPFTNPATRVCFGRFLPHGDAVWLWEPCGLQREIGIAFPGLGHVLAQEIADLIPGAIVADGRP